MNNKLTRENVYEQREMKTRKKINSTFKCSTCGEKVSIQTHTYFYLVNEYLTNQFDSGRYCSKECVFKFIADRKVNVEEAVKEHNRLMDLLDELDKDQ